MDVKKDHAVSYARALEFCRPLVLASPPGVPVLDSQQKTDTLYEAANTAVDEIVEDADDESDELYELVQEIVGLLAEDLGTLVEDELGAFEVV